MCSVDWDICATFQSLHATTNDWVPKHFGSAPTRNVRKGATHSYVNVCEKKCILRLLRAESVYISRWEKDGRVRAGEKAGH